jgi:hypothetical protein
MKSQSHIQVRGLPSMNVIKVIVRTNMWGNLIYVKDQNKHKLRQQMKPGLKCKIEFNK